MASRANLTAEQWAAWLRAHAERYAHTPALHGGEMTEIADAIEQQTAELRRLSNPVAGDLTNRLRAYAHRAENPNTDDATWAYLSPTTAREAADTIDRLRAIAEQLRPQGDGWTPGTLQDATGRTLDWTRTPDTRLRARPGGFTWPNPTAE